MGLLMVGALEAPPAFTPHNWELKMDITDVLPSIQRTITRLWESECSRLNRQASDAHCLADALMPEYKLRIEAASVPVIRVSAQWVLELLSADRADELIHALHRACLVLPRFQRTLSNNATRSAEYVEGARVFRLANSDTFTLPERHFKTTVAFTLVCPLSGEVEHVADIPISKLHDEIHSARHRLTARVYQHDQIASLLDTIAAMKKSVEEPLAMSISTEPHCIRLRYHYEEAVSD